MRMGSQSCPELSRSAGRGPFMRPLCLVACQSLGDTWHPTCLCIRLKPLLVWCTSPITSGVGCSAGFRSPYSTSRLPATTDMGQAWGKASAREACQTHTFRCAMAASSSCTAMHTRSPFCRPRGHHMDVTAIRTWTHEFPTHFQHAMFARASSFSGIEGHIKPTSVLSASKLVMLSDHC